MNFNHKRFHQKINLILFSLFVLNFPILLRASALYNAIVREEYQKALEMIRANPNEAVQDGLSFTQAASRGRHELLEAYLQAFVNQTDSGGGTALAKAITFEHPETVQFLIQHGANVNVRLYAGKTPLCVAAEFGNLQIVRMLVRAGADIGARADSGLTPLEIAKQNNHLNIVEYLTSPRAKEISHQIAPATHRRLGEQSPMSLLPQYLMGDIARKAAAAEALDKDDENAE